MKVGCGSIYLITGCMFAGKTTRLMDEACLRDRDEILVVKHASDVRYGTHEVLYTHSSRTLPCIVATTLKDVLDHPSYQRIKHIFIDEGQFFDDLADFCKIACETGGKHIHIAALNGDAHRRPFPSIAEIMPMLTSVITLYACCLRCQGSTNSKALFSYRKRTAADGDVADDVGGSEKYEALCRFHYIEATTRGGT
jgi:thymidine kinase